MNKKIENIVIIGSGPAGYTAAIYTARAGLEPVLFASSVEAGGDLMKTTDVENFPGFPKGIMGPDLMEEMKNQALKFGCKMINDDVISVDLKEKVKQVTTSQNGTVLAHAVILATGSEYRKLNIPGRKSFQDTVFRTAQPVMVLSFGIRMLLLQVVGILPWRRQYF